MAGMPAFVNWSAHRGDGMSEAAAIHAKLNSLARGPRPPSARSPLPSSVAARDHIESLEAQNKSLRAEVLDQRTAGQEWRLRSAADEAKIASFEAQNHSLRAQVLALQAENKQARTGIGADNERATVDNSIMTEVERSPLLLDRSQLTHCAVCA